MSFVGSRCHFSKLSLSVTSMFSPFTRKGGAPVGIRCGLGGARGYRLPLQKTQCQSFSLFLLLRPRDGVAPFLLVLPAPPFFFLRVGLCLAFLSSGEEFQCCASSVPRGRRFETRDFLLRLRRPFRPVSGVFSCTR